jgi:HAD superfamily phosphoserine phosphatase-like hydrolase
LLVVMDFDGTITAADCLDVLFRRHLESYPLVLEAIRSGSVSHGEAVRRGIAGMHIPREQALREFADAAALREGFAAFLRRLRAGSGRAAVISAGFREGIERVWRREGLPDVRLFAGELVERPPRDLRLELHPAFGDCDLCGPRACKGPIVDALREPGDHVVAFGDGRRDLCMARRADFVFARSALACACEREGIAYTQLEDFTAVLNTVLERLRREEGPS